MSIEAITWALRVPVGGNSKVVLLGLANHAHPDGSESYPSLETLAAYAHCDRSTARRNVRKLEADGWIFRDGDGPKGQAKYRLALDATGGETPRVAPALAGGGTDASEGVAPVPPEPSKETSKGTGEAAREDSSSKLPEDFPEELRPHAIAVYRLLTQVAVQHNARAVKPLALGRVIMARDRKPLVKAAHDFAAWAADPPRPIRDVVASYRRWLDNERDLQTVERLQGAPAPNGSSPAKRFTRED
jgi:hypothetical protein